MMSVEVEKEEVSLRLLSAPARHVAHKARRKSLIACWPKQVQSVDGTCFTLTTLTQPQVCSRKGTFDADASELASVGVAYISAARQAH